jgi:molecular chaperone GrpE
MGKKKRREIDERETDHQLTAEAAETAESVEPDAGLKEAEAPAAAADTAVAGVGHMELVEPPEEAVRRLREELDGLNDRYLRLAAEFDNFRKRAIRERGELRHRAQGDLVRGMLEGLDDLGRVADLQADETRVGDVIEGVRLVERKLLQELGQMGLERVGSKGEVFDPNQHEAVGALPLSGDGEEGTVGAVLQPGYRFAGGLVRPARVMVLVATEDLAAEE